MNKLIAVASAYSAHSSSGHPQER